MRIHACKRRLKSLKMSSVLLPLNVRPVRGNWFPSCGATGPAKIWWMNRSKERHNKYFIFTGLLVIQSSLDARQWTTDWGSEALYLVWMVRPTRWSRFIVFVWEEHSFSHLSDFLEILVEMWVLVNFKVNQFLKLFCKRNLERRNIIKIKGYNIFQKERKNKK